MPVNLTVSLNYVIVLQINKLINVIWMKFKLCMVKIKVYFKSTRTPKIKPEPAEWHSRTRVNALEGDTEVDCQRILQEGRKMEYTCLRLYKQIITPRNPPLS